MDVDAADLRIVDALRSEPREGVRLLMESYHGFLVGLALRIMADEDAARDAAQILYISIFEHGLRFAGRSSLRTFLSKAVVNVCRDMHRKTKRRSALMARWSEEPEENVMNEADEPERLSIVRELLFRLPMDFRLPLQLSVWEGMAYEEIADTLGIPLNTVRTRIARARTKLNRLLAAAGVYA
jgi:RNA polymerase sigma-70 factor (ECF subfamily)